MFQIRFNMSSQAGSPSQ